MKKIFTVLTLFIIVQLIAIDLSHWTQLSANYFSTDAENGIEIITSASADADSISSTEKIGFKLQHETSGRINKYLSFSVQDEVFFSEKSHEQKNSYLYNDAKLKLYFQNQNHFVKLQYSNRFYEEENTLLLYSPSILENIQQKTVHNTYFIYKTEYNKFDVSLFSNVRNLDYSYARLEEEDDARDDDEEEWESHQAWDNDWITSFVAGYQINNTLRLFGKAYYKDDLNENDDYDHTQLGAGIEYDNRFDFFNSFSARFTYLNNQSVAIADYKEHYLLTEARYTKRFNNGFAGFLAYINRSCYDKENSELLRISNVIKMHLKYSYLTENTKDSFILAGIKYNPENEGNLVLAELNQYLFNNLYLGASAKFAPDLYTQIVGKIEYLITPINSIWLKNEFTDFENKFSQSIVTLGTTLIF